MTLRLRLMLSVGVVVLVSLAAVYLGSTRVVKLQFEQLRVGVPERPPDLTAIAAAIDAHHRQHGWRSIGPLVTRLRNAHLGPDRELLLVGRDGRLIAASSLPEGGLDVRRAPNGRLRVQYEADGAPVRILVSGIDARIGPSDAPVASLYVVPRWHERMRDPVRAVNRWLFYLACATGVGALLFTAFLARNIVRPIERLQSAVQRIEEGQLGYQVAVQSDDEVGKLARAFNAMSAQLERDERLRRNMVNDVAHELRTPLTNLVCAVEALQDGLRQPTREVIDSLHDDLDMLQRLVDDLQTLTLAEAGKLPLHREPLDLREEVERCVRAMPDEARQRVRTNVDELPIVADRVRFQQIVTNLLRNALTHARAAGRIEIIGRAVPGGVELVVADDGPGIPPQHLPHIFDRFYRADPSRDRTTGGAGLGLAIVKNLVELHGGRIEAESEPGHGAAFRIRFPAAA